MFFNCNYCFHFRSDFPEVYTFAPQFMGDRVCFYNSYNHPDADYENRDSLII